MRKNIVLTLFSVLLMIVSNTASAASCSYMASACMDDDMKNDSEKSMYSDKHFDATIWTLLTKIEDLLVKVKEHGKGHSSYWGDNDEYDKPEKDGKYAKGDESKGDKYRKSGKHENDGRYGKGEKHGRGDSWSAYLDKQDDFEGFWMNGGHDKKGHHGFEGRHGYKDWMKEYSHKPHYDTDMPAVPVPAALWLFGSGLIGLAAFSRRKRR